MKLTFFFKVVCPFFTTYSSRIRGLKAYADEIIGVRRERTHRVQAKTTLVQGKWYADKKYRVDRDSNLWPRPEKDDLSFNQPCQELAYR